MFPPIKGGRSAFHLSRGICFSGLLRSREEWPRAATAGAARNSAAAADTGAEPAWANAAIAAADAAAGAAPAGARISQPGCFPATRSFVKSSRRESRGTGQRADLEGDARNQRNLVQPAHRDQR